MLAMDQLFRFFARFPLWLLHGMGAVVGWLVYGLSSRYRQRWAENRDQAGLSKAQVRGSCQVGFRPGPARAAARSAPLAARCGRRAARRG